ncbi:conserved hypothetical protein [Talaromyces stipitatus ATCC 10500]|uniref:Uncharacterized protein n=1 Tax=Talaromyces stipitatus (strain ATCC 10500 / CBS 375.48 / QM 6759 / NRRL 1006) TaxID=441959 RepID=B8MI60_TALSN|nr:uncharacterized protein TSTA_022760 [Talaromyces stipitatus ATCC 10500]EED17222.1 conserved hypothetical protein [Talaromyces stipitatus ATCC 10500]
MSLISGGYKFGPGCATPNHTLIKEFLRWYIHIAKGKISKSGRVVTFMVLNFTERLFGGFKENMQVTIAPKDRSKIFHWIKRTLTEEEKAIENVKDLDYSFMKRDFLRVIASMWQADQRQFMPSLLKAIIILAL